MSCCTTHSHSDCDPNDEPLSSALDNFTTEFFGTITKSCVNNQIVWNLPCDLATGSPDFPRLPGESLACYFVRFVTLFNSGLAFSPGNKGYRSTALTATDVVLFTTVDLINQDFTGTLAGPVDIFLSSNGATNGDEFYLSFTGLVITATNNIEIRSDSTSLLVIDTPGTLDGYLKAVYTGTIWKLTLTSVNIT